MSIEIPKLKSRVATFANSLDELESVLEPLFSQTLPETVLNLEPLQQAKLQTDVPYVIYDLVFMYLKLKGVDPKSHPVINELDRIRQYFDKISNAENPPQRKTKVDSEVAGRFIKAAISSANFQKPGPEANTPVPAEASSSRVPVKRTAKMVEREEYERKLKDKEGMDDEDDDLEVIGEDADGDVKMDTDEANLAGRRKRQRPVVDPFAGYGDEPTANAATEDASRPDPASTLSSIPQPKAKKSTSSTGGAKKKKGKKKGAES